MGRREDLVFCSWQAAPVVLLSQTCPVLSAKQMWHRDLSSRESRQWSETGSSPAADDPVCWSNTGESLPKAHGWPNICESLVNVRLAATAEHRSPTIAFCFFTYSKKKPKSGSKWFILSQHFSKALRFNCHLLMFVRRKWKTWRLVALAEWSTVWLMVHWVTQRCFEAPPPRTSPSQLASLAPL